MKSVVVAAPLVACILVACSAGTRPHRYPVPAVVGQLVIDDDAFGRLARAVRADVEADLRGDLHDRKAEKDRRFVLALLDALDDRWTDAVAELDRIRAIETEPRARVMTGLTIRMWADARSHGGDTPEAFRDAMERMIVALPVELVRPDLTMLRTMGQVFTPETCRQLVNEAISAHVRDGTISLDDAQTIAFQRYAMKRLVQVGPVIDAVLGAHGIAPM